MNKVYLVMRGSTHGGKDAKVVSIHSTMDKAKGGIHTAIALSNKDWEQVDNTIWKNKDADEGISQQYLYISEWFVDYPVA
ncbi:MAG: hypothetical protein EB127_07635 [Alphaproteobacteria bacterium]|nr:hypothetical protein [Alphaproteobacteria bacterium]